MDYNFSQFDEKVRAINEWLSKEYAGLRTGRATPTLVEGVQVSAYGSRTPIKQVSSITVEDARTLRITPWDAGLVKEVEKAVTEADLGVGLSSDGTSVRLSFPELTAERRAEFVKMAKGKLEEARTGIKQARDDVWSDIQAKERDSELSEDDKFTLKDELQKRVDTANAELESLFAKKESEITEH